MTVVKVFLFVVIYFFIISLAVNEQKLNIVLVEFNEFDKICPKFWSKIQNSYVEKFSTNCSYTIMASVKNRELLLLENVCLLTNTLLATICKRVENQEVFFSLYLNSSDKKSSCPIKVDKTEDLNHPVLLNISQLLQNETLCKKICYDFNDFEKQCSVLIEIENYLKNLNAQYSSVNNTNIVNDTLKIKSLIPNSGNKSPYERVQENVLKSKEIVKKNDAESNTDFVTLKKSNETYVKQYEQNLSYSIINKELNDLNKKETSRQKGKIIPQFRKNLKDEFDSFKFQPISNGSFDDEKSETNAFIDSDLNVDNSENVFPMVKEDHINKVSHQNHIYSGEYFQAEESHFFFYFLMLSSLLILGYFAFHNKNKILAYALEGKSERRSRRRPNPTRYRKLESNLEEAIVANVPQTTSSSAAVVY